MQFGDFRLQLGVLWHRVCAGSTLLTLRVYWRSLHKRASRTSDLRSASRRFSRELLRGARLPGCQPTQQLRAQSQTEAWRRAWLCPPAGTKQWRNSCDYLSNGLSRLRRWIHAAIGAVRCCFKLKAHSQYWHYSGDCESCGNSCLALEPRDNLYLAPAFLWLGFARESGHCWYKIWCIHRSLCKLWLIETWTVLQRWLAK